MCILVLIKIRLYQKKRLMNHMLYKPSHPRLWTALSIKKLKPCTVLCGFFEFNIGSDMERNTLESFNVYIYCNVCN